MTKKKLVESVSTDLGLDIGQAQRVVQLVIDRVLETLAAEGRIELRNFGVFEVQPRAARRARNPRTGETVHVAASQRVAFKPGRIMQQRLEHGPRQQGEAAELPPAGPVS